MYSLNITVADNTMEDNLTHQKRTVNSVEELISIPANEIMHDADELVVAPNSMSEDNLLGIRYAARFLRHRGLVEESEDLLRECKIQQVPNYDLDDSEFIQKLRSEGIEPHIQGWMQIGTGKEAIRYPIIVLNGDIVRWEIFYQKLKHDLKQEENNESN